MPEHGCTISSPCESDGSGELPVINPSPAEPGIFLFYATSAVS